MTWVSVETFGIGYTGKSVQCGPVTIWERIVHYAYARNGNAHHPTAYKAWDIFAVGNPGNGAPAMSCRTIKEARECVKEYFCETVSTDKEAQEESA